MFFVSLANVDKDGGDGSVSVHVDHCEDVRKVSVPCRSIHQSGKEKNEGRKKTIWLKKKR